MASQDSTATMATAGRVPIGDLIFYLAVFGVGDDSSAGRRAWSCPMRASRPSAKVTIFPEELFEPSLARCPEMVSTSPSFRLDFVMPRRVSIPGGEAEKPQLVVLPFSSLTSR